MPGSLPSTVALTSIADGAAIVAADPRNNFSAAQTAINALIAALGVTAKGDVLAATASGALSNVAAGTNGQVLSSDSTQAAGLRWVTPSTSTVYKANFDIVNTAAETNLISQSIAGNTLGINGAVLVTVEADYLNNSGAGRGLQIKVKLGATTLYDDAIASPNIAASAVHRKFIMSFLLANEGATNIQGVAGHIGLSQNQAATAGIGQWGANAGAWNGTAFGATYQFGGSSAEDTTAAKTLVVSATHSTNNASLELKGAVSALVIT